MLVRLSCYGEGADGPLSAVLHAALGRHWDRVM